MYDKMLPNLIDKMGVISVIPLKFLQRANNFDVSRGGSHAILHTGENWLFPSSAREFDSVVNFFHSSSLITVLCCIFLLDSIHVFRVQLLFDKVGY